MPSSDVRDRVGLLGREGLTVMPLVIVAVVVAYAVTLRLTPTPADRDGAPTGATL
ncbi:hypothetical protein ACFVAG_23400 [Streptomyces sp. NPDC057644]|uniref:hypothetical protein n=1 Tax=Streptomyces sp. NPDC057644 TaxID=3346191 RepID=UPI0036954D9F